MSSNKRKNILLVATGSVAFIKVKQIIDLLKKDFNVKVIISPILRNNLKHINFEFEQEDNDLLSFPLHIAHAKWADLILVAPATANTLSKFVCGIADNQVMSTLLAARSKIIFVPAMNTYMYQAIKQRDVINKIYDLGHMMIGPVYGKLWEGENGLGRMEEPKNIVNKVINYFNQKGKKILIVNGASRVAIDPIRYITNFASGKLGKLLSNELRLLGHNVKLINVANYNSQDLLNEIKLHDFDVYVSPAAINDFTIKPFNEKIKKTREITIKLLQDIDIVSEVAKWNKDIILFKHDNSKENAIQKKGKVKAKFVVWNKIGSMNHNKITGAIIYQDKEILFNEITKQELAIMIANAI